MSPIVSIYISLEDDVSRIAARLKKEKHSDIVLVCPKRCLLFADSINLKLLKKQADLLGKQVSILTMDEKGQQFAQQAGFELKTLPKPGKSGGIFDIKPAAQKPVPSQAPPEVRGTPEGQVSGPIASTVRGIKKAAMHLAASAPAVFKESHESETKILEKTLPPALPALSKLKGMPEEPLTRIGVRVKDIHNEKKAENENVRKSAGNVKYAQRVVAGLIALSLLAILGAVFFVLPRATVAVFPRTEPITRDIIDITANTKTTEPDPQALILPAQKVSETLELTSKFQAQGKREVGNKAAGAVRLYNFSQQPLNLKAATTILSVGNKTYRLVNDIQGLKVTKYKDLKTKEVDESSLDEPVEVVADQGGEEYNLPAGVRMEVTNQVFGSKPQFLFGRTEKAVMGGTSRFISLVTQQDIDASRTALGDQLLKMINDKLISSGLQMLEKAYAVEVLQFSTDKPVNTESPSFTATLKAKITGLAIKPEHLSSLVNDRISQTLSANKSLESTSQMPDYKLKTVDLAAEQASISVHYEGRAVMNMNLNNITTELVGKNRRQAAEILRSKAEVDRIDITLAPSWQKNFPYLKSKINVYIEREKGN